MHFELTLEGPMDDRRRFGAVTRSPLKQGRVTTVSGEAGLTADTLLRERCGIRRSRMGSGNPCGAPLERQGTSEIGPWRRRLLRGSRDGNVVGRTRRARLPNRILFGECAGARHHARRLKRMSGEYPHPPCTPPARTGYQVEYSKEETTDGGNETESPHDDGHRDCDVDAIT